MSDAPVTGLEPEAAARSPSTPVVSRQLLLVLSAFALTALFYWPTSLEIADVWSDTVRRRYTHGWMVLAVSLGLIWRNRRKLAAARIQGPRLGWLAVVAVSASWLVGYNAGLLALSTLVMPLLALGSIWAAGGRTLARSASFPLLFLYFALPMWELLNPSLQWLTTVVNLVLTQLSGIPVVMDGNVIHIPEGWFEIAGGCSGLHFFVVALAIAVLHGHIDRDDRRSRLMLIALCGGLALLTNWLRVFVIIVAGHVTNMQHFLVEVDHYYFGWILFSFALAGYVYMAEHLPRRARPEDDVPRPSGGMGEYARSSIMLTVAALAFGPVWALVQPQGSGEVADLPSTIAGWSGPNQSLGDWRPVFANADEEVLVRYVRDSAITVDVYRAVYFSQRQGKELRGLGNTVAGAHYRELDAAQRQIRIGAVFVPLVQHGVESWDGRKRLVWSLFIVAGEASALGLKDQIEYGVRSLFGPPPAYLLALSAECTPECNSARGALDAFAADVLPAILAGTPAEAR